MNDDFTLERNGPRLCRISDHRSLSFSEIVRETFRKGVSYRVYDGGKKRRRMVHRFRNDQINCESSMSEAMAENITYGNVWLDAMKKRGK